MDTKSIIKNLTKGLDNTDFVTLGDIDPFKDVSTWTPSGCPILDYKLGTLGFPTGIIEFRGKSKGGKTTAALHVAKEHQDKFKEKSLVVIQSFERRDNKFYAQQIGIDPDCVVVIKARFIEDMFAKTDMFLNDAYKMWEAGGGKRRDLKVTLIMDSLGAANSRSEHDVAKENLEEYRKSLAKGTESKKISNAPASFARAAKQGAKYFLAEIYEKEICYIIINHTYDNIGSVGKKSFGGAWIEYLPTIRLDFTQKEWVKEGDDEVGQISRVKVEKNDYGVRKKIEVEIMLGYGYVLSQEEIEWATQKGILKGNAKKSFMDGKLEWNGRKQLYQLYRDKNKMLKLLVKRITREMHKEVLESKQIS